MRWRIAKNKWNMRGLPWPGAVGIEEDDPELAVPSLICWFSRGIDQEILQQVIDDHNARHAGAR